MIQQDTIVVVFLSLYIHQHRHDCLCRYTYYSSMYSFCPFCRALMLPALSLAPWLIFFPLTTIVAIGIQYSYSIRATINIYRDDSSNHHDWLTLFSLFTIVAIGIHYSYRIRGDDNNTINNNDTSLISMDVFLVYGGGSSVFDDDDDDDEDAVVFMAPRLLLGNTTIRMIILRGCCTKTSSWEHDDGRLCV